jgi:hypothetical protein
VTICVEAPKFAVGWSDCTYASAAGAKVSVVGICGVVTVAGFDGSERLPAMSRATTAYV